MHGVYSNVETNPAWSLMVHDNRCGGQYDVHSDVESDMWSTSRHGQHFHVKYKMWWFTNRFGAQYDVEPDHLPYSCGEQCRTTRFGVQSDVEPDNCPLFPHFRPIGRHLRKKEEYACRKCTAVAENRLSPGSRNQDIRANMWNVLFWIWA